MYVCVCVCVCKWKSECAFMCVCVCVCVCFLVLRIGGIYETQLHTRVQSQHKRSVPYCHNRSATAVVVMFCMKTALESNRNNVSEVGSALFGW